LSAGTTDNGQPTTDQCAVLPDESYSYDANGNRTSATFGTSTSAYVIGPGNEILSDGTYTYTYDAEGNRTARFIDTNADGALDSGDTSVTIYGWDNRNRLVSVTSYAAYGDAPTQTVTYSYDAQNRWIGETVTSADGSAHRTAFAYDVLSPLPLGEGQGEGSGPGAGQIVLQFDKDVSSATGPASALTVADLSHRYLWGPAVDQILADEQLPAPPSGSLPTANCPPPTVVWPLTDNQGTVRDLAVYNAATGVTSVANHRVYDSFGNLESQTNAAVGCIFGFTGRPLDPAGTGLQNNNARIYDAVLGGWLSKDPTSFTAGDTNTGRYVDNSPANATDPTGTVIVSARPIASYLGQYAADITDAGAKSGDQYVYSAAGAAVGNDALRTEIVTRMINSTEKYVVAGNTPADCVANITKNVDARATIAQLASKNPFPFGTNPKPPAPPPNWKEKFPKPMDWYKHLKAEGRAFSCIVSLELIVDAATGLWAGDEPAHTATHSIGNPTQLTKGQVPTTLLQDVVPGDWAYITNTGKAVLPNTQEAVIYIGGGLYYGNVNTDPGNSGTENIGTMAQWYVYFGGHAQAPTTWVYTTVGLSNKR
jgi:RHS repeat-associated protein